jgi:peptidyl-tRNA hydrolase, PTH2 family
MSKIEPKQIIVVRKDLNMRKGKIAAQSSHASMGSILNYAHKNYEGELIINIEKPAVREWLEGRFTKICVSVDSEQELLEIYNKAIEHKVNVKLIKDAGLTEFNGIPTLTCLALGPDYPENIDPITKHLKLL